MTLTTSPKRNTRPSGMKRCKAKSNSTGKQCKNPPIHGAEVCRMHGGSAPQVKAAAKRRLAIQEGIKGVAEYVSEFGLPEPDDRHPGEHLMRALALSSMLVESLAKVSANLDARPGSDVYEAWERERDRHTRIAKACADAGIAERQTRIVEEQAQRFAGALHGVLTDLGIEMDENAMTIVRRHMLALDAPEDTTED